MNCKRFQKMIITDYLDGEINAERKKLVEEHLTRCSHCREFKEAVTKSVIEPFRKAEKVKPSDSIWHRIKERIEGEIERSLTPRPAADLIENLKRIFYVPRPVFVVATVMVVVLFLGIFTKLYTSKQEITRLQSEEQVEYIAYLFTENGDMSNGEDVGYGTAIEEYFL